MLSHEDSAQILRVTSDGISAKVETVSERQSHFDVLDELGARASDILLANGVIWVEGISDAIYIRTWIKRYCDEKGMKSPVEGSEYAFVEYGGSCLAHYEYLAKSPSAIKTMELEALLPALSLSRNAYVIMDSDRASSADTLAPRKQNAINAIGEPNVWVTDCREVENYLSAAVLREAGYVKPLRRYDKFKDFPGSKREFALKAAAALNRIENGNYPMDWKSYDLEDRISTLINKINEWKR
jgi:predicted ATP-dependent endonuclease of OLD family